MIEVEAKYKISNFESFKERAAKLGKYVGKKRKIDDYYTDLPLDKYPKKSLRIRREGNEHIVNFKRSLSYEHGVHAKSETEFRVSSVRGFINLIEDMGFKKWLTKEKITYLYKVKDNLHIEINYVKELGWFIEIEYLAKPNEVKMAQKEVLKVASELGLRGKDIVKEGYTKQLWNRKH